MRAKVIANLYLQFAIDQISGLGIRSMSKPF
jgi:hypothetical protein